MSSAVLSSSAHQTGAAGSDSRAGKHLVFRLGCEEFAIAVLQVREILSLPDITPVPNTRPHIRGVINLRGKIIPIVDLRQKFQMPPSEQPAKDCIIVVQAQRETESILVGVVVDCVTEVCQISAGDIDDAPDFGEDVDTVWLLGIARKANGMRILLDTDRLLSAAELEGLERVTARKPTVS